MEEVHGSYTKSRRAGDATLTYDDNGNLVSVVQLDQNGNPLTTVYLYDVENRLVSASGGSTAALRYDPLGRLYETSGAAGATRFLYDGDALVAEYDTSGTMLRRYAHAVGTDTPLVWYEGSGSGNRRWLWADHLGSVFAVTDGTNLVHANTYDEYGIPGTSNGGRFQFTGQAWIPELQMYHYKARIYSPTLGRFLQVDPVGYEDQMNLYAYVRNDPVNFRDPTGESCADLERGDENSYCDEENPEDDAPPITVTGQRRDRPSMQDIAEKTLSLPVDPDGGSGARAAAGLILFSNRVGSARRSGESLVSAAAIGVGLGQQSRPPTGSRPISQTQWSGDHEQIKRDIGAGAADSVRISPNQEVWAREPDGTWTNHGPARNFTGSGRASGRTGADRQRNNRRRR